MVQFNLTNVTSALKSVLKPPHCRTFFNVLSSKKTYDGHKVIGYTQKQLYDVVSNIDEYKNFIPYCTNSEVLKIQEISNREKKLTAVLGVGFNGISETYISDVTCEKPGLVRADVSDDLFKNLSAEWKITPHIVYSQLASVFFDDMNMMIIDAFERRCNTLYGPPASTI
ncbi:21794_t:CDS:2 [Rhizophagus irregularis]|nr:21794_t:CDS:2 [Rhizophagus irregularis]